MPEMIFPGKLDKYVYLASLETGSPPEKALANFIKRELVFNNDLSEPDTDFYEKINDALNILKKIALNEQVKEEKAINSIKQKIQKAINNPNLPLVLKEQFKEQLAQLNTVYNGIDEKNINLIKNINIIEQDLNLFTRRLQEINNKLIDPKEVFNRLEYRQEAQLDNFILNLGKNKNKQFTHDKLVAQKLKELMDKIIGDQFNDIPGFTTLILGLLYIDFTSKMQNEQQLNIYKIDSETLEQQLESYLLRNTSNELSEKNETNLIKLFKNNTEETRNLIKDFSTFLGVDFITKKEFEKFTQQEQELKQQKKLTPEQKKELKKIREKIKFYNAKIDTIDQDFLTFRFKTATSHGLLNEIRRVIEKNGIDVSKNVGTDTIVPVGIATLTIKDENIQKELLKTSREINDIFGDNFTKIQKSPITIETFSQAIKDEQQMNEKIQKQLTRTFEEIKKIDEDYGDSFISFESLKLSQTHENNTKSNEMYKGRTMQILSALTKLYAAPGFNAALMDQNLLITFLLNIGDTTLGSKNKESLETYLSLFAGILMFDDVSNIAKEALLNLAEETPQQNSTQILHVYPVNNIFFPISLILNNIITQVEFALQHSLSLIIDYNKTAKATLKTPSPTFLKEKATPEDWVELSNQTLKNTQLQITFLAGFTNYISELFKAMNPQ